MRAEAVAMPEPQAKMTMVGYLQAVQSSAISAVQCSKVQLTSVFQKQDDGQNHVCNHLSSLSLPNMSYDPPIHSWPCFGPGHLIPLLTPPPPGWLPLLT